MLRKIRIALALIFFLGITALFLDFTGTVHAWLGWMAKVQFLPALLALHVGIVVALLLLTFVLGRVYCSVVCPLGVMQDVVSRIAKFRKKGRNKYAYSAPKTWLRITVMVVFVLALLLGVGSLVALLAPYSAYGRIVSSLFQPVYIAANNVLAGMAERADSYAFYTADVWMKSVATLSVAVVTLVVIAVLAWRNGRTYCNTICPVGSLLGFVARFSLLKPVIDKSKCNGCRLCERNCKAACIDAKAHKIDYSRCVACMDCIDKCHKHAISYAWRAKTDHVGKNGDEKVDKSRRAFVTATAVATASAILKAQEKTVDGGLAVIEDKQIPERKTPITPPGSLSAKNMAQHCTACQLCVSVCPNGVLRPSTDMMKLMQPESSYERGYCRPECTKCADVCPAGAIRPITVAEKSSIQIGHAVWIKKNCIPLTDGVECGNCARHCPAGAIQMVASDADDDESPKIPVINTEKCIGCGACENLCPARPFSAIYVEGHEVHRFI
ncbi:MAG: 4Fe-4S binding protein [Bacteroidaceae bacterium]|nr:4Fe-4S binding protein [Bacteroidaceae bacterium]